MTFFTAMGVGSPKNAPTVYAQMPLTGHQSLIDSLKGYTPILYYPALILSLQTTVLKYPDVPTASVASTIHVTNGIGGHCGYGIGTAGATSTKPMFGTRFLISKTESPALTSSKCRSDTEYRR